MRSTQSMRPDVKPGGESDADAAIDRGEQAGQARLRRRSDDLPLRSPLDRTKMLGELYDQLGKVRRTLEAAAPIMEAIEELWQTSGSDTVDLLLSRAERFTKDADLDLASKILDATIDMAPETPRRGIKRATVEFLQQRL